ncbi:substrate-binding domain-containing protein [Clostridium luticellarii]|jgi:LacI family purine nucleotide synthesis repressor|uniref:substrate-binding domain-containing protein n=1 Tax=Clostridium luticellarii TaxID=1691940 RepID=UPI0023556041|nr:substrate-binding domain-containing protein [Clostridium luticellarii]MCI1945495.1 substrate-binding domain-containing protein [Clostridium luticellarii]
MSTIKDVANLAGVSAGTVSIILNGKAAERKISSKTQERVLDAVKELNYHPNISARKLRSQYVSNNPTIALYWASDARVNLMARFLKGLLNATIQLKSNFDIIICPYKNDFLYLENGLKQRNIYNAAIIANTSISDMKYLENTVPKIPVVLFNRFSDKYCAVHVDNYKMGVESALLFSKMGHKNAAIMLAKSVYLAMDVRNKGFMETCKKSGIQILPENIIISDNTIKGGVEAAGKFIKLDNPPRALFCNSDNIALGALHVFNKKGIKVPEDVEIIAVGMSSAENTEFSNPPLTVINIPMEEMATSCIKIISDIIDHDVEKPTSVLFDTPMIIRDSCGNKYKATWK